MSTSILVIGESGTGKSTAIRNLNPNETFVISVLDKPMPFKGARKHYKTADGEDGNYFASDSCGAILKGLHSINTNRPNVKSIIIDDFQYLMAHEYMRRANEKGFTKFSEISQHAWSVMHLAGNLRNDLMVFILAHSEQREDGIFRCKTIGKMLNEKITVEGMFTIVLHSLIQDDEYGFLTQTTKNYLAKSPMEMFDDLFITNDLQFVRDKADNYFNEDIDQ